MSTGDVPRCIYCGNYIYGLQHTCFYVPFVRATYGNTPLSPINFSFNPNEDEFPDEEIDGEFDPIP